jgi:hypothetical protein
MREIPELYQGLMDVYELDRLIGDIIEAMVEEETEEEEGKRPFTYAEIRDFMEAHYDKAYDPEDRHLERKPTQREINYALEVMLSETDRNEQVIREKDGFIYSISEEEKEVRANADHDAAYKLDRAQVG